MEPTNSASPVVKHSELYLDTIISQVEDTLFKVPSRYFHEKSGVFSVAFKISKSTDEGTEVDPVKLSPMPHAAGAVDFGYLARIVVALSAGLGVPTYNLNQWFSVLKLSTAWEFNDIRSLAISNMSSSASLKLGGLEEWGTFLDLSHHSPQFCDLRQIAITRLNDLVSTSAIQRFKLGYKYYVEDWVFEGLKGLALQKDLPKLEDLRRDLGTDTALRLLYLRAQNISSC
ncbi:hypothetical protein PQX77_013195 [Marasmius sp. AFHP31]|nr:hypothetical protein PQX77_013195 [Marasmius sp. AFHP31]